MKEASVLKARAEELYGRQLKRVRLIHDTSEFTKLDCCWQGRCSQFSNLVIGGFLFKAEWGLL